MASSTTLPVQLPQASTYNHPCGDLLDSGTRKEYLDIIVPLYRASMEGDWKAAKVILDQDPRDLVRYSITEKKETPLHVAVAGRSTRFVRRLVNRMETVDLELQNGDGNTAFCIAVISGNVGMVKIMVEKNRALLNIGGSNNMMPLYLAACHGKPDVVTFLYDQSDKMTGHGWDNMRNDVLLKCIETEIFDVTLRILEDNEQLPQVEHMWFMLHALAQKRKAFYENMLLDIIRPTHRLFRQLIWSVNRRGIKTKDATPLLRLLWKRIMEKPKDVIDKILRGRLVLQGNTETYPSQILFTAAKMNNTQFLVELIREYPDLIWKRNDDGQSIFHIAVSHRHHDTYSLLYDIGSMKDMITPITDQQGNNILHLVGKNPEQNDHEGLLTTHFQMFGEFLWYNEVNGILPPSYREVKNADGDTPQELFIMNHKKLVLEGMKSINGTINISMVVAALVCTIGFSLANSVPGGFNENSGFPIFKNNGYFFAYVAMNVLSFLFATSSIICFLGVILSRNHGNMKVSIEGWSMGQLLLLISIFFISMALFFSLLVLYSDGISKIILDVCASLVMALYAFMCFSLVYDTVTAYRNMFRLGKHRLYRKNPKF